MDLLSLYHNLPPPARSACDKVGSAIFSKLLGSALKTLTAKGSAAFAGTYQQWRESVESQADDTRLAAAFEDFFSRPPTVKPTGC